MSSNKTKIKTITISLPVEMSQDMQLVAKAENRTMSELIRESFRQYQAQRSFTSLVKKGKAAAKKKKLTPKDFGGPFED
ncbi:MAG TPA: ribbon-helix-helix domain-containing protein [Candidatus Babeliales bacterium]|nr:ribbon-helix-helix domain-containing protein [Candidatus Babeliales bacterium]